MVTMAVELKLIPKQLTEHERPRLDNLYFDVFIEGEWRGSRRLMATELKLYAEGSLKLEGYDGR